MKVSLQTNTGISVEVQPARFELVRTRINGQASEAELVPAAWAGPNLMKGIQRFGCVSTTTGLLRFDRATMGVLYASSSGGLTAMLFDLAEPEIQAWLNHAKGHGNLPIVFQCGRSTKLVRVPLDTDIVDLADQASACVRVTQDQVVMAMQAVVGQFDNLEMSAKWGLGLAPLTQCSVSVLTPTASIGGSSSTAH